MPDVGDASPYDAVLLVSFGGPEHPDDVLPFLENVTRGRNIPAQRLLEVGQHYFDFGGRSPINEQNRALLTAIRNDLARRGIDLPVYWGNRNWHPMLADAIGAMRVDGARRAVVFVTSAYSSYSGCRQYREDLAGAIEAVGPGAPRLDKLRHYFNHPGFVSTMVSTTSDALDALPSDVRDEVHLVFVTHSVPVAMAASSGPPRAYGEGALGAAEIGAYEAQHLDVARLVVQGIRAERATRDDSGGKLPWRLVYCSRSGSPTQPWLEPDVNDHLEALAAAGARGAVLVPIGFVSDHMEVKYDLDTEALATAERVGLPVTRAATAGTDPRFVAMIVDLILERAAIERGEEPVRSCVGGLGPGHDVCPAGCCPNLRGPRPAIAGADPITDGQRRTEVAREATAHARP